MKKILYVVSTLQPCGPVNQLSYIIKYLNRLEFYPIILTLSKEPKESMKRYFEEDLKVQVDTLGLTRIKGFIFAKKNIQKFLQNNCIDLVHSQGIRADGLMSKIDIPTVATLRNYPFHDYPMSYGYLKGTIMAKAHLSFLTKIDEPRVVSKSISEMLKTWNMYKIEYVRNGIDRARFNSVDKDNLRQRLGLPEDKKIFISVGYLSNRKDPLTIIKAFKMANIDKSMLILLGSGELDTVCQSEINNRIKLIGNVNNVGEYLTASDYFVSSALSEGLPNSVLEAMVCGLPCILSDIPPHNEIDTLNKNASLLFKVKDIEELSLAMKNILNQDYMTMSQASKDIIDRYLSAEIMSCRYQKIYDKLLGST